MAITIGANKLNENPIPGAASSTYLLTQDAGSNRFLYAEVAVASSRTCTSITYNGVEMNLLDANLIAGAVNTRHYRFYLADPAEGSHSLVISYDDVNNTATGIYAQGFTGCSGISNSEWNGLVASPHTRTMTASTGDVLFGSGISQYTISTITIDGTNYYSPNFTTNASVNGIRYTGQITSALVAGLNSYTNDCGSITYLVSNSWVLFGEAAPTTRRIFIM